MENELNHDNIIEILNQGVRKYMDLSYSGLGGDKVLTRSWYLFYLAPNRINNEIINADLNRKMKQQIFTGKSFFTPVYFLHQS